MSFPSPNQPTINMSSPKGSSGSSQHVSAAPSPGGGMSPACTGPMNPEEKYIDQAMNQIFRSSSKVLLNCKDGGSMNAYLEGARKVIQSMYDLWQKKQLCDVTLECKDGVLYAHKLVMAAYSEQLCKRFSEYPLSQAITISLREFQSSTVYVLLEFFYTTELKINMNNVGELLQLAKELGVAYVTAGAMNFLGNLTIQNCFHFLDIAIKHNLKDLMEKVDRFMSDHFSEIIQTDGFLTISADRLVRLLTENAKNNKGGELELFRAIVRWIEYRRPERLSLAPMLMRCIKMHQIMPRDLVNHVEKVDFVTQIPELFHMLYSAMTYHALNSGSGGMMYK